MLRTTFCSYRSFRFVGQDYLFEPRPEGDATVFRKAYVDSNVLVPPTAAPAERQRIIQRLPKTKRHKHFGSMQSSQALAQSIFGTITVLDRISLLSAVLAEDGRLAFGPDLHGATLELEKSILTLGERADRSTSVDVWIDSNYRVAIECKLGEAYFGQCSRPSLTEDDNRFAAQHCDGSYTRQRERTSFCALTEIGVRYWDYMEALFGWAPNKVHRPCPLKEPYQLVRNVLAACVANDRNLVIDRGHALVIYDRRNPAMKLGGTCDRQWAMLNESLRVPGLLRRISWQSLIAQLPSDAVLDWLKKELTAKYGLLADEPLSTI
jgi:hypothetical protein